MPGIFALALTLVLPVVAPGAPAADCKFSRGNPIGETSSWYDQFKCYQGAIDFWMFNPAPGKTPYYDTDLLASQLEFLLATPRAAQQAVIWSLHLSAAWHMFSEDRFQKLRRKIAHNALHNTDDPLRIRSPKDLRLALKMQGDFNSSEPMYNDLAAAIAEGEKAIPQIEARNAHHHAEQERIQNLLR